MKNGRGERIRTSDPLLPKQVRYQAALRPDLYAAMSGRRKGSFRTAQERGEVRDRRWLACWIAVSDLISLADISRSLPKGKVTESGIKKKGRSPSFLLPLQWCKLVSTEQAPSV